VGVAPPAAAVYKQNAKTKKPKNQSSKIGKISAFFALKWRGQGIIVFSSIEMFDFVPIPTLFEKNW